MLECLDVRPISRYTPPVQVSKVISRRWGSQLGDSTDYHVRRTGPSASVHWHNNDLSGSVELMREIAKAILEVTEDSGDKSE